MPLIRVALRCLPACPPTTQPATLVSFPNYLARPTPHHTTTVAHCSYLYVDHPQITV